MRPILLILVAACLCGGVCAQDSGDAASSYGTMQATWGGPGLGASYSYDAVNPVTPAWTGDADDCVVGSPVFDSWSNNNTLTVNVTQYGYLICWVDANDDGVWTADERHEYAPEIILSQSGNYTFTGIKIHATTDFIRNGHNKCAVRITLQENLGGPPTLSPTGSFYLGEVEDWLIDVEPAKFVVATEGVRSPVEGKYYMSDLTAQNGTPPYVWTQISGTLPAGISLAQNVNKFTFSGTAAAGTGAGIIDYPIGVQVTDAASHTATRTINLRVLPPAATLPFVDTFSTATGWTLGQTWSRGVATAYTSTGTSWDGWPATEPGFDATPASTDNMILGDTIGGSRPDFMPETTWAMSPVVDCTGVAQVEVRFSRWLSASNYNHEQVRVQVSNDGGIWTDVWNNNFSYGWKNIADFSWTPFTYDISAVAGNHNHVQVRFGIGPCDWPQYLPLPWWGYTERFGNWCIDDVIIRQKPVENVLVAQSFSIASSSTYFDSVTGQTLPMLYPLNSYTFTAIVNNTGASAVTVTSFEVGAVQVGTSTFYGTQSCWIDVGDFTLATPITVPAGVTGFSIQGTLIADYIPIQLALVPMDATLYLYGTQIGTGADIRTAATFRFGMSQSMQPGLHVTEVQVGGTPIVNGAAPAGLRDFGSVIAGQSSNWLNIVLKNTDSTPINLALAALSGPDAAQFTLNNGGFLTPIVNQTGVFSYFSIRFNPSSGGVKNATVTFTHDATNTGTPFTFQIRGTGAANAPLLQVTEGSVTGPGISYDAPAVGGRDFGNVDISVGPSGALVIHLHNTGTQPLMLGTVLLQGTQAADFVLDLTGFTATLAPGTGTNFSIFFDPSTVGIKTALLSFTHNDTSVTTPFIFNLTGQGIINAPVLVVTEGGGAPITPGTPASGGRQFGVQDVSSGPTTPLTVIVRNNGWQDLVLGMPSMAGGYPGDFAINSTGMSFTLSHNQATTFTVAFDPISKGPKNALVSMTHNDTAGPSPFTFAVSGLATDPNGVIILTTTLALGQATKAYGPVALQAGGGTAPYTWTFVSGVLPTGISLDQGGALSGAPTIDGPFTFRVRVTDNLGGVEEKTLQIIIQPAPGSLSKSNGPAGGSCTTGEESAAAFLLLLLLISVIVRRARRA